MQILKVVGNLVRRTRLKQRSRPRDGASANTCRKCGYEFPHRDKLCPATGKTCNECKKPNHFACCCLAPKFQHVKEVSDNTSSSLQFDSEEEYLYNITVKNIGKLKGSKTPKPQIKVNDKTITATIDTGLMRKLNTGLERITRLITCLDIR
jgi:hypothetical protein